MVAWLVTELDDPQLRSIYETRQGAISDQQVKTFGVHPCWVVTL